MKKFLAGVCVIATLGGFVVALLQYYENKSKYDLTGEWVLNLTIESTSYNPYKNLRVGYKVYFNQNNREIVGRGEKWWVNDEEIPFSQHDPITIDGVITSNRLPLSFILRGSKRETVGHFDMKVISNDQLEGLFSTTGANSRGSVTMKRLVIK